MNVILSDDLKEATKYFFYLHWPSSKWNDPPEWDEPWSLEGEMKGGKKQGVYALLNEKREVIYIGVGASLGGGLYEGYGLGARTKRYSRVAPNQEGVPVIARRYLPSPEWKDKGLSSITTIGFEVKQAYLAYGLEAYLLSKYLPPFNKVRAARLSNEQVLQADA